MPRRRFRLSSWLFALALSPGIMPLGSAHAVEEQGLPSLGNTSSVTTNEEYELGRAWLRQFRAQAPQWNDPIVNDYLASLIARLTPYSQVGNLQTTIVLVDNRTLNAFAVPGGVVGVNSGLFAFAEDEGSFVSVLAHELGHLSQRHYARNMARAEQTQLPAMAAMLAGMLIAASGGGDAGLATAMGSQAAFMQDRLSYSRRFEQEADRIGLQAMAAAGYDPEAMVRMFAAMQRMARLQGGNPPEFLLTHPVTESRLSDAQARASQLSVAATPRSDLLYDMMRARALAHIYRSTPDQATVRMERENAEETALRYLSALTDANRGNVDQALQTLDQLAVEQPDLALLPVSAADIALNARRFDDAITRSQRQLRFMPNYLPAQMILAEAQLQRDPQAAFDLLRRLTASQPENPQGFNLLAEAAGRSGHDGWGHLARAEYLQLTGNIDSGIRQLGIARSAAERENDQLALARIEQRRDDFIAYRETMDKFR